MDIIDVRIFVRGILNGYYGCTNLAILKTSCLILYFQLQVSPIRIKPQFKWLTTDCA